MSKMKQYGAIFVIALVAFALGVFASPRPTGNVVADTKNTVLGKDATEMQQLKAFLGKVDDQPFATPLPEHLYKTLKDKDGNVISATFLHFDKPVGQDSNVLFIGDAVPGKFCDSPEVQGLIKKGYVHFHTTNKVATPDAGHGGIGGEPGFWLRHISVVSGQIDYNFMPTVPPACN